MKNAVRLHNSMGTGYVSVVVIFVVIALTTLAAFSFSAAGSNEKLSDKNKAAMAAYYEADGRARKTLMEIDKAAYSASSFGSLSGFEFEQELSLIPAVRYKMGSEGYTVSWEAEISEKLTLSCEAVFYRDASAHEGKRYRITAWNSIPEGSQQEAPLNLWDGTF